MTVMRNGAAFWLSVEGERRWRGLLGSGGAEMVMDNPFWDIRCDGFAERLLSEHHHYR